MSQRADRRAKTKTQLTPADGIVPAQAHSALENQGAAAARWSARAHAAARRAADAKLSRTPTPRKTGAPPGPWLHTLNASAKNSKSQRSPTCSSISLPDTAAHLGFDWAAVQAGAPRPGTIQAGSGASPLHRYPTPTRRNLPLLPGAPLS